MWNPSTSDCKCNQVWKIDKYLDIVNLSCKKYLFGELVLVLACEDEILNTTKTSFGDLAIKLSLFYLCMDLLTVEDLRRNVYGIIMVSKITWLV